MMPLTMAKAGDTVTIRKITGKDEVRLHLAELGFVVDSQVTIVNEIAGNLIVQVKESRLALDKTMANMRGLLPVWGSRLWVYLAPIRMLFPVPCLSGVGMPLDKAAADALIARYPPHFSEDLACCYCFFRDEAGDARVLLFDTEETCRKKLNLLRSLGVRRVFGEIPQT